MTPLAKDLTTMLEDISMADPRPPEELSLGTVNGRRVYEAWWKERQGRIAAAKALREARDEVAELKGHVKQLEDQRDEARAWGQQV